MRTPTAKMALFWPILWALSLHAIVFALLFISFVKTPELPPSRPTVKATLYQLESQSKASSQSAQKITGEADKTAAKQVEREQLEQKKRQAQQAAAQRKAEQERLIAAKQAAAKKKEAEQRKRAAEQKAAEQRKLELQKAELAKKRAAEKAKAEAERKRKQAELEKKRAEKLAQQKAQAEQKKLDAELAAKKAAEQARQAARRAQEEKEAAALAELLQQETQYQRAQADKQAEEDIARLNDLIVQLVSSHWIRPAGARNGMVVTVRVDILADGTIRHATVAQSSGNQAFDNSAVAAVLSVGRIREIQALERSVYERSYRQLTMDFKPEDLGL